MLNALYAFARRLRMKTLKPFGRMSDGSTFRLHLCDLNPEVAASLALWFQDVDAVEVLTGDLLDLDCDALVAPANSFGDMSGGLDKRIDDFHDGEAQRRLMERIAERWHGELPVGSAELLTLPSRRFPFLVVAPTMRVPSRISGTLNAYLAFRAALAAVVEHDRGDGRRITALAASGLGTGVGAMTGEESAVQMRAGYDMIVGEGWKRFAHPLEAPFTLGSEYRPAGDEIR